jgi:hypothetical protein
VDWIHLAQYRLKWCALVNTLINLRISYKAVNVFSRMTPPHVVG